LIDHRKDMTDMLSKGVELERRSKAESEPCESRLSRSRRLSDRWRPECSWPKRRPSHISPSHRTKRTSAQKGCTSNAGPALV